MSPFAGTATGGVTSTDLASILLLVFGRNGDPNTPNSPQLYANNVLTEIGGMISTYTVQHRKPPQGLKDPSMFADSLPTGLGAARKGEIVVLWGVAPVDPGGTDPAGNEILAYTKEAPDSGGGVLTRNLKLKEMTAEEFKAAPKVAGTIQDSAKAKGKKS